MTTKHRSRKYLCISMLVSASLLLTAASSPILMAQKISGPQVLDGDVYDYAINATSQYTVFMSDPVTDHIMELYSVPTWGGERILLSPGMTEERGVLDFIISPDGTKVVFWVGFGEDEDRAEAIYVVPIAAGTPINLTMAITPGMNLEGIEISADNLWLFYVLGNDATNEHVLYRVNLSGAIAPVAVSPTTLDCVDLQFKAMPTDHGVMYARSRTGLTGTDLVYVDPSWVTDVLVTVNGTIVDGAITPDGTRAIFIEDEYSLGEDDLVSVLIADGTRTVLNEPLVAGGNVVDFKISKDNGEVVYRADQDVNDVFEIYTVEFEHGWVYDLIPSMVAGGDVVDYELVYYENKAIGVAYLADQLVDEKFDLGVVAMNAGVSYHLSAGMIANGDVTAFEVSPNGIAVVFVADYFLDGVYNLMISTVVGSDLAPIGIKKEDGTVDWPSYSDVVEFSIAPNSSAVTFIANLDQQFVEDLYVVQYSDVFTRRKISAPMDNPSHVESYLITPNSQGVVYRANQDDWETWELYSVFYRFPQYMPILFR